MGGAARVVWAVVGLGIALLFAGSGCERPPRKQLEAAFARQESAIESGAYAKVYASMSSASKAMIDADIDMIRYGTSSQVRSLKPSQLRRVMIVRNRMGKELIETVTGEELIAWLFRQEVFGSYSGRGFEPTNYEITGDAGVVELELNRSAQNAVAVRDFIMDERKKTTLPKVRMPWVREGATNGRGGAWVYDMVTASQEMDQVISKQASDKGMSVSTFLEGIERERAGEIRSDWDRAPFKRPGR